MYTLKGFVNIDALANNTPDNVSALGELSNKSMTYAIEKGYYTYTQAKNCELVTFTSRRDGAKMQAPAKYTEHILAIAQWIFDQSVAGKFSTDALAFQTLFLAKWESPVKNFESGKMISARGQWMPTYIKWQLDDPSEENSLIIWFADATFQVQYDEYQIVVIPPIEPVDTFQKVLTDVEKVYANFTIPGLHKNVLTKTKGEPYTYLVSKDYLWHDREDKTSTMMTTWTVAIYGAAGNNLELIKAALSKYILANSKYQRVDWIPVFPDIFTSTEFTVIPFWNNRSVPDETARGSLYSPVVTYDGLPAFLYNFVKYVPQSHIMKYCQLSGIQYKSLAAAFCGGPENRDSKYKLTDFLPDFAVIPTTSIDVNRMAASTVEFAVKLVTAVITAEEMDEYSFVGVNQTRVFRNNMMYVCFDHDDVGYYILSRMSMAKILKVDLGS